MTTWWAAHPGLRNVISRNGTLGIDIEGAGSDQQSIIGNYRHNDGWYDATRQWLRGNWHSRWRPRQPCGGLIRQPAQHHQRQQADRSADQWAGHEGT